MGVGMARLVLLGTKGGPAVRAAGPSMMPTSSLVEIAGQTLVIDCGLGVSRGLVLAGVSLPGISRILLTHYHSDHMLEFGGLLHTAWTAGLNNVVSVHGPPGLQTIWQGFLAMMDYDIGLRIQDEGRPDLRRLVHLAPYDAEIGEIATIFEQDGLRILAFRNHHPPVSHSYALRLEAEGKIIVFSGDTAPFAELVGFCRGADLLVHEAMLPSGVEQVIRRTAVLDSGKLRHHLHASHSMAADVGRLAAAAGVGGVVLHHLIPPERADASDAAWRQAVTSGGFDGRCWIGHDGLEIVLD